MLLSMVIGVAASVLAVFFANDNRAVVAVSLFGYQVRGSLGVVIVSAAALGVLLGVVIMLPAVIGRAWAAIRYKRKLEDLGGPQARGG